VSAPTISVVAPVHNEVDNLEAVAEEITRALAAFSFELILVDDGSTDGSWAIIRGIAARDPRVVGLRLARNFGQTAALAAGFDAARGELIASIDADLQNDPADLPAMFAKIAEGFDLVCGWRRTRRDPWLSRVLPSRLANALIALVTRVPLHDYGCALKVYRSEFVKPLRLVGEMHRFAPALSASLGARLAEIPVNHRARVAGRSKYGLGRTLKVVLDLVTVKFMNAYLGKPIYIFGGFGLALGFVGAILAGVTLYNKLARDIFVKDQPLFLVSIFLALVSVQLILLGVLAEIVVRVYYDIKDTRPYVVRESTTGSARPGP
jgi:glycosyltransferase involved in cell wall biosynthesis